MLGGKITTQEKGLRRTYINGTPMPYFMWPQAWGQSSTGRSIALKNFQDCPCSSREYLSICPESHNCWVDKEVMFTFDWILMTRATEMVFPTIISSKNPDEWLNCLGLIQLSKFPQISGVSKLQGIFM